MTAMPNLGLLHEEYEADGDTVLFRCRECGYTSLSLGGLHAHCEKHRAVGFGPFKLIVPPWRLGDFDALMDLTDVVRVSDETRIQLDDVEQL